MRRDKRVEFYAGRAMFGGIPRFIFTDSQVFERFSIATVNQ
jgi:hypothetical protein